MTTLFVSEKSAISLFRHVYLRHFCAVNWLLERRQSNGYLLVQLAVVCHHVTVSMTTGDDVTLAVALGGVAVVTVVPVNGGSGSTS